MSMNRLISRIGAIARDVHRDFDDEQPKGVQDNSTKFSTLRECRCQNH